jgi:hypothetical protein
MAARYPYLAGALASLRFCWLFSVHRDKSSGFVSSRPRLLPPESFLIDLLLCVVWDTESINKPQKWQYKCISSSVTKGVVTLNVWQIALLLTRPWMYILSSKKNLPPKFHWAFPTYRLHMLTDSLQPTHTPLYSTACASACRLIEILCV